MTAEFGKGFSKRNLERMRKFYIYFPIATTVSSQLSWSHYLEILKVDERLTLEEDHFYPDLVFYNRLLKCFVIIDLKIGKVTHQDIGQMQMYVNYYDREIKSNDENPTVGILLSTLKNKTVVKYTLPEDNKNIFSSSYKLHLPTEQELIDAVEEEKKNLELNE